VRFGIDMGKHIRRRWGTRQGPDGAKIYTPTPATVSRVLALHFSLCTSGGKRGSETHLSEEAWLGKRGGGPSCPSWPLALCRVTTGGPRTCWR